MSGFQTGASPCSSPKATAPLHLKGGELQRHDPQDNGAGGTPTAAHPSVRGSWGALRTPLQSSRVSRN